MVEWLETQAFEPEAKVTQKGELALRGGIVDVFPLASPWPVRIEFFGNEVDSIRYFDPQTQMSLDKVDSIVLSPAGEFGILLREIDEAPDDKKAETVSSLLDHLPPSTVLVVCDSGTIEDFADAYSEQIPDDDPFSQTWTDVHPKRPPPPPPPPPQKKPRAAQQKVFERFSGRHNLKRNFSIPSISTLEN